jgi:tetratricopeptide (TPR) repeat protein
MKKFIALIATLFAVSFIAAVSYTNNTYQKLADEYTKKAQNAFDAGEYDMSVEYAQKAQDNAKLSEAYVKMMIARSSAQSDMKNASDKLDWAKKINADRDFPMAYSAAQKSYENAQNAFNGEDYAGASSYAKQVLDALAGVHEITPLPEFYVVRPWADTKDCYWNISGRPYVYNNPLLWENLYQENKNNMPRPSDPNLILPGMKMKIPSLTGEYREGVYTPSKQYEPYSAK